MKIFSLVEDEWTIKETKSSEWDDEIDYKSF